MSQNNSKEDPSKDPEIDITDLILGDSSNSDSQSENKSVESSEALPKPEPSKLRKVLLPLFGGLLFGALTAIITIFKIVWVSNKILICYYPNVDNER